MYTIHILWAVVNIYFLPNKMSGSKKQDFWPKINCNRMKLPNFVNPSAVSSSKIGHDFCIKEVQKWKLSNNSFNKKCAPKLVFLIEKKSERFK